jgi:Helicase HerA, central domain
LLEPLTTSELAVFVRVPHEEYPGYQVADYVRYGVEVPTLTPTSHQIAIGSVLDRGQPAGNQLRIARNDFTKHGLIVGLTGSGKTNTCMSLLRQLWDRGRGVPFLVVESAKSEYRNLRTHTDFKNLRVFTVADETISPLRFNPFEVPRNTLVQTHIDYIKSLFSAAFVLYPPMPYVLEQSLQEIYEDRGWDLAQNRNLRGNSPRAFPTLSDLVQKIPAVIERMGYDERITMDVKAGLLARVNQLRSGGGKALMFDGRQAFDDNLLFSSPCVLELKRLVSDDEKAFLIGLILIRLYEMCEDDPRRQNGTLHHITLIEEAHRLLRDTSTEQSTEVANPRGRAIEVFANILSEIRAYGEGILIAEQVPTKLTPDAVKNTSLKIVHRLLAEDDRQLLGKSINLDESQTRGLSLLATGDAVVFSEGLHKPALIHVPLFEDTGHAKNVGPEELRQARERLLGSCPYCSQVGASCSAARATTEDTFLLIFHRLINALRFSPQHAAAYYNALSDSHASNLGNAQIPLRCVLARLAEAECDSRGRSHNWDFEFVDRVLRALLDECDALGSDKPPIGSFEQLLREAYSSLPRPFPGCASCKIVCHLRYDTSFSTRQEQAEFRETFLKAPVPWNTMAALCLPAFNRMPTEAVKAQQQAALCFGIQQLHSLGISAHKQRQHASLLATHLSLEP